MYTYEEINPPFNETVSYERYEEIKEELEEYKHKNYDLKDDLEAVVETIIEFGNKYSFNEAYPKLIEFLKGRNLI